MEDNEIKKALDYWKKFDKEIDEMLLARYKGDKDLLEQKEIVKITFEVFDLIKYLQSEKYLLEAEANRYKRYYFNHEYDKLVNEAKAEAYKEFAERLCEDRVSNDNTVILAKCLLKELAGEDNESKN